ncbi:uncharacterized protein LOC113790239, partial [Dermatophagoides pteronyssinus]|uniref:uncharacterized protein LOC113790239 n=1 Tax=Dermatophagoides pteronyssinus TaxID=6956 RepID=UPI003F66D5A3
MSSCHKREESNTNNNNSNNKKWLNFLDQFIFHCKKCDELITSLINTNDSSSSSSSSSKHLIRLAVCNGFPMELFFYCFVGKTFNKRSFPINYQHCVFMASSSVPIIVQKNHEKLIYLDCDDNNNICQYKPQSLPEMVDITERLLKYPRSLWNRPNDLSSWRTSFSRSNRKFFLESFDLECLFDLESDKNSSNCKFLSVSITKSNNGNKQSIVINPNESKNYSELLTPEFKLSNLFMKRKIRIPFIPKKSASNNEQLSIGKSKMTKSLFNRSSTIPYDPKNHTQIIGSSNTIFKRPQTFKKLADSTKIVKKTRSSKANQSNRKLKQSKNVNSQESLTKVKQSSNMVEKQHELIDDEQTIKDSIVDNLLHIFQSCHSDITLLQKTMDQLFTTFWKNAIKILQPSSMPNISEQIETIIDDSDQDKSQQNTNRSIPCP